MKLENGEVWGFEHAIRGARNPMNSWAKSDSTTINPGLTTQGFIIGLKDMDLLQRLIKAGPEHRKFMRQIFVSVDITAPLYWWKEFDTYKIGTVSNSCSTMHKLASKEITIDDFEMDDFERVKVYDREPYNPDDYTDEIWYDVINICETLRRRYIETKDVRYWKELIRILPEGYLQKRTITMNYENLYTIVRQRRCHKLWEWSTFIDWVHTLPYSDKLIFCDYN